VGGMTMEACMKRAINLAVLICLSLATAAQVHASNLTDKDDQVEKMSMDSQVEEVDGYSYDDYANQTNIETSQLNKDINGLKDKIARLKSQKAAAEKRAQRSSESYNVTKKEKFEAEKQAKRFEQILTKEQREVSILEKKLDKIKDQKAKADDRTKKAKESLNQVEQQRRDLLRQQRDLTASLQKEMRIKQNMDKRRVSKVAEVYRLKSNVTKLQAQTERLQIQNRTNTNLTSKNKVSSN
jgi:chromosome segregation ATPase